MKNCDLFPKKYIMILLRPSIKSIKTLTGAIHQKNNMTTLFSRFIQNLCRVLVHRSYIYRHTHVCIWTSFKCVLFCECVWVFKHVFLHNSGSQFHNTYLYHKHIGQSLFTFKCIRETKIRNKKCEGKKGYLCLTH